MTETTLVGVKRVTIKLGEYGRWFVTIEGNGYPVDFDVSSVDLVKLRDDGYIIVDPLGWCDLSPDCPPELREPWTSQAAMDADSAGYGYSYIGATSADYGHNEEE